LDQHFGHVSEANWNDSHASVKSYPLPTGYAQSGTAQSVSGTPDKLLPQGRFLANYHFVPFIDDSELKPSVKRPTDNPMRIIINMEGSDPTNEERLYAEAVYRSVGLALDMLKQEKLDSFKALVWFGAEAVERWGRQNNPKVIIYPTVPTPPRPDGRQKE
jgi:hypothetical protein